MILDTNIFCDLQDTIKESFQQEGQEGFFSELRSRFRRAVTEIKEKQQFYARLLEKKRALALEGESNRALFRRDSRGQLTNEIDNELLKFLHDSDEPFQETGFMQKILRFLQLLCEGHNLHLQNYLRMQKNCAESYDLISETAAFLESLEREIDPTNISIAIQVLITLTEFCQGIAALSLNCNYNVLPNSNNIFLCRTDEFI
jgi:hypothetical protein